MLKKNMDINADIGEGFGPYELGDDQGIMSFVSSVNIACGFHAGDYLIMDKTIKNALVKGIKIGAHPGYPDRYGFGRRPMGFSHDEIRAQLLYQIGALRTMVVSQGGRLHHVKLHGALYNAAADDLSLARCVAKTIQAIDPNLIVYGLGKSQMMVAANEIGLTAMAEVFADRRYNDEGRLMPRTVNGSVLTTEAQVMDQVHMLVEKGIVISHKGNPIALQGQTICVHGDTPGSVAIAKNIYDYLRLDKE